MQPFVNRKNVGFKNEDKTRKYQAVQLSKPICLTSYTEAAKGLLPVAPVQEEVLFIYLRFFEYEKDLVKVAVTDFAAVIVTVQVPVPEHAPDQPEKVAPLFADAAKVTFP